MKHLSVSDSVSFKLIEFECNDIEKFGGNFEQMANLGIKNHGKVFDRNGDILKLWEPVREFVLESYSAYKEA